MSEAAFRVDAGEVQEIIETDLPHNRVQACIRAANVMVTGRLASTDLSVDELTQIELWLAAHFVALADPRVVKETVGHASTSYQTGQTGMGLDATTYGQQALTFDWTGTLRDLSSTRRTAFQTF